jgi:hypothetical protein
VIASAASASGRAAPARAWAALALAFYAVHAGHHLSRGHPEHLLWMCHLGVLIVGAGFALRSPALNAIGFAWLCIGDLLWLLELAGGGEFLPTSLLTHVGGLALGAFGVARFGMPRDVWWRAALAFAALQLFCRFVTPPAANVNVAHAVWSGFESVFPSYPVYAALLLAGLAAGFLAVETLGRRLTRVGAPAR